MLFYTVMKPLVQVALRVFFRRIEVRHRERLHAAGPAAAGRQPPQHPHGPAAGGREPPPAHCFSGQKHVFQKPRVRRHHAVGQLHSHLPAAGCAARRWPATRRAGAAQNEATFGRCYDYLGQGGTIMIFPEGTSVSERRLRPLKTGAARIALGAEARHDFKLGLQVVPVAINYFDPSPFRSDVLLNVAPPILVAHYADAYAQDPEAAADALTDAIRQALERRLVITRDAAEDDLVQQIERTFGDHLNPDDDPDTLYDNFQLSQTLLQAVAWFEQHAPAPRGHARPASDLPDHLRRHRLTDEPWKTSGAAPWPACSTWCWAARVALRGAQQLSALHSAFDWWPSAPPRR